MAVIVGIFSFNGIEVIAVTSGETKNPEVAIPAALRTMLLRLFLFYVLAITVIVTIDSLDGHGRQGRRTESVRHRLPALGHQARRRHHEFRGHQRGAVEHEHRHLPLLAHAVFAFPRGLRAAAARAT